MKRDRAYLRNQRRRIINKKYHIREFTWGKEFTKEYYENNPKGKLSKGKIHCSCSMCRKKSYDEIRHRDKKSYCFKITNYKYRCYISAYNMQVYSSG